jgi:hypothetical protein
MATITLEISDQQFATWTRGAVCHPGNPDLPAFVAHAVTFYLERRRLLLELAQRMQREGRL